MKPSETLDMYERLEINENADDEEIKSAYKKAVLKWHPDRNEDKEMSHIEFIAVSEAFEKLSKKHPNNIFEYGDYEPEKRDYDFYNEFFKKFFKEDMEFQELFAKQPHLKTLAIIYKILRGY